MFIKYFPPKRGEYSVEYLQNALSEMNLSLTFRQSFFDGPIIFGLLEGDQSVIDKIWFILEKRFCAVEVTEDEYKAAALNAFVPYDGPEEKPEGEEGIMESQYIEPEHRPNFSKWMKEQGIDIEDTENIKAAIAVNYEPINKTDRFVKHLDKASELNIKKPVK